MDAKGHRMDIVHRLVENILNVQNDDLPLETIDVTKKCILDTLACVIGGSTAAGSNEIVKYLKEEGGKEESTIFVYGGKVPSPNAVLANSTMARALDFDTVHEGAGVHASATIVPVALAMAEKVGPLRGKDFMTAVALGSDLICRLRSASGSRSHTSGWSSETFGPFGAAAAAGKILGLNEEMLINAMGLALSQAASGLQSFIDGSLAVRLQQGLSARAGLVSAVLAQRGFSGAKNILEGKYGFYPLYFHGDYAPDKLTEDLGKRFEGTYVSFKPFPSCKYTHGPIAAVLEILSEHEIRPEKIRKITVEVNQNAYNICYQPRAKKVVPQSVIDAQFSIPYTVAVGIIKKDVFIDDFTEIAIRDPSALDLSDKVTVEVNPEIDKMDLNVAPSIVEIEMYDQKRYSKRIDFVKGHPNHPMTFEDCARKLEKCASFSASLALKGNVGRLIELIYAFEKVDDVSEIMRLLI
jgi:2-methylcitrate dehydratase PrpD